MAKTNGGFSWRGWTTFVVTISFIVDTISGIILYIAPPGRIANWTNWNIWGLTKGEWGAIHTIFGYVLLIIVGIHLYYNWRMFWNFIWSKVKRAINMRREMAGATLLCLFVFLGTLWDIPPFSSTMELGEYFKDSWEESRVQTPVAHGELLTLKEFAEKTGVPLEKVLEGLQSKGYKVRDSEMTIHEVSEDNKVSPSQLYEAMKASGVKPKEGETLGSGLGMGTKTLEVLCSETGIPLDEALGRLRSKGIKAGPGDRLKDIAGKAGKTPMDVYNIAKGEE
ncbi:MAG: DUF4405 domain-containing protein [Deltaproteobacteria bacterium]|nr:DUF4405 domain-containing protein [Deltaproteobacteria bacterium]